jgi:predicted GNAT family acetyltransferase
MALTATSDPERIRATLDRVVRADPVRGTTLGTIAASLDAGGWCASDGADLLAVRSGFDYPLAIAGAWDDAARRELIALLRTLDKLRGASGPADAVDAVVTALWPDQRTHRIEQCLFRLDELVEPGALPGRAFVADDSHRDLVRSWYAAFMTEVGVAERHSERAADRALATGGCFFWADESDRPVSLAARRAVVAGSARIGPVYTPSEHRGKGYGSAVTAATTRSVLAEGAVPVLFTDLANPTSNKIYQALGYRPVERRVMVTVS